MRLSEEIFNDGIGHQAAMPAIPVGKAMNTHQPVLKANGYFIRGVHFMFHPRVRVATKHPK